MVRLPNLDKDLVKEVLGLEMKFDDQDDPAWIDAHTAA